MLRKEVQDMIFNMMGYGMMDGYGYYGFTGLLFSLLLIGLVILVYLWVAKLWREVFRKAKK